MDFKNNFAFLFTLTSTSVMQKVCFDMVKVTVEGLMFKLTLSGVLVSCEVCLDMPEVKVTVEGLKCLNFQKHNFYICKMDVKKT